MSIEPCVEHRPMLEVVSVLCQQLIQWFPKIDLLFPLRVERYTMLQIQLDHPLRLDGVHAAAAADTQIFLILLDLKLDQVVKCLRIFC